MGWDQDNHYHPSRPLSIFINLSLSQTWLSGDGMKGGRAREGFLSHLPSVYFFLIIHLLLLLLLLFFLNVFSWWISLFFSNERPIYVFFLEMMVIFRKNWNLKRILNEEGLWFSFSSQSNELFSAYPISWEISVPQRLGLMGSFVIPIRKTYLSSDDWPYLVFRRI